MWQQFNLDNKLDSLSYFVQLKAVFKNSKFYNYKLSKVAHHLNVNGKCLKHHLDYLQSQGLVYIKDGHLQLLGTNKLQLKYSGKKLIYIKVQQCVRDTKYVVKSIPVLCSLARQCKNVLKWDKANTTPAPRNKTNTHFGYITLSNSKIKTYINRKSVSTVQNWKSRLKKLNVLGWRFKYMKLEDYMFKFKKSIDEMIVLRKFGGLYVQLSNQYRLCGYSVSRYIYSGSNKVA